MRSLNIMIYPGVGIRRLFSSLHPRSPSTGTTPDHRDLIQNGDVHLREGKVDFALKYYQKAARIDPSSLAEKKSAQVQGMMGRYMESIASLDRATGIDPLDPQPWVCRGFLFWRLQRWEEALASFERAVALRPEDGYARYCRALAAEEVAKRIRRRTGR